MNKKSVVIILLGVLLLAALIIVSVDKTRQRREITLPNGSVVKLLDVTYGTNHMRSLTFAQKLKKWLPFFPVGRLGYVVSPPLDSPEPTLGLWFDREGGLALNDSQFFILSGDDGVEVKAMGQQNVWGTGYAELFDVFPRDSKMIEAKVVLSGAGTPFVHSESFQFENPSPQPSSAPLVAQPFPASCWDRGVEFKALQLLVSPASLDALPNSLSYVVNKPGAADSTWVARITKISDHQGNEVRVHPERYENGKTRFDRGLWPTSPWRIHLVYHKEATFEPHEFGVLTEIPIPASGTLDTLEKDLPINGNAVRIKWIALGPYNEGETSYLSQGVTLKVIQPKGMVVAVEETTDDQKRKVKEIDSADDSDDGSRRFSFQTEPDARFLNVRFSLNEEYNAELILQPTIDPSAGNGP